MIERELVLENLSVIWKRRKTEIKDRTKSPKYPFGIDHLDDITHGIRRGKVTILAARTSEAKTAFALQAALNLASAGKVVAYLSLEDDAGQLVERLASNVMEIDNQTLQNGTYDKDKFDSSALDKILKNIKMVMIDSYGFTFDEIQRVLDTVDPKPEIVFLDYVQMIDQAPGQSEYDALSRFALRCKKFSEKNNIGFFVVSQINRKGAEDGRPMAHHLQGCGKLEQVSDLLLILYRPHSYKDHSYDYEEGKGMDGKKVVINGMRECPVHYVELFVAKNKNGPRGDVVKLHFAGQYSKYEEWRSC